MALANEPSVGLCYIQQHVQQSTPSVLTLEVHDPWASRRGLQASPKPICRIEMWTQLRQVIAHSAASHFCAE